MRQELGAAEARRSDDSAARSCGQQQAEARGRLLPAAHWRYIGAPNDGRGYVYRDRNGGAIKRASLRAGRRLKLLGSGPLLTHALAASPEPVRVVLRLGGAVYCMEFGGTTRLEPGKMFSAVDAPASPRLPE